MKLSLYGNRVCTYYFVSGSEIDVNELCHLSTKKGTKYGFTDLDLI